jgi:UDP-N-acetylglucosamine 2-epimerase (hydrolysing)|tara:strand:- start:651 stop:1775 length:1125 start_codon:yes stop_codon:yes gene_type:complete
MKKKILFVTCTRADYGKLKSLIINIQKNNSFISRVFVSGMHNMKRYGSTYEEIEKDKINGIYRYSNQTKNMRMDEILMSTMRGFSPFLIRYNPDLVIVHGDRIEPLACALSSLLNNFLVAHIEGGEVSGTVDEMLRHSISKISHLHLVSNKTARKRLIQMGENKRYIFEVGSPDVDLILNKDLPKIESARKRYNIRFNNFGISIIHPVTTNIKNLKRESEIFFSALVKTNLNYIIIFPNNDLGSEIILKEIHKLKNNNKFKIFPSIRFEYYLTLLKNSKFIIGNSSSGIMGAPYYGVTTINIGTRQSNRLKTKLIKNISFNEKEIIKTINQIKNRKIIKRKFFGEGNSANKIEKLLLSNKIWNISKQKSFIDLI